MTRVLVIAATPAMRAGLRALLDSPAIQVVGESAALSGVVSMLDQADVLLLADDAALPEVGRLLNGEARAGVLLMSDSDRATALLRGMSLFGWGIASSDASPTELQATVLAIAQGLVVLPSAMAQRMLTQRPADAQSEPLIEPLTARELEVLELMGQGLPNKQIARALQISEHTVKFHISAVFAKLGAASRTDAVGRAARQGLIAL
jgi:DNA-binding NarL/FixJ family response regulator